MQVAQHHYHKIKKSSGTLTKAQTKLNEIMDDMIYILGSLGVLIFVPQLVAVWTQKDITGVSLVSWLGMCIASTLWFFYGLIHKAKPIMFTNALALVVQLFIIIGILVHR